MVTFILQRKPINFRIILLSSKKRAIFHIILSFPALLEWHLSCGTFGTSEHDKTHFHHQLCAPLLLRFSTMSRIFPPWKSHITTQLNANIEKLGPSAAYVSLATVRPDKTAANRMVVFRFVNLCSVAGRMRTDDSAPKQRVRRRESRWRDWIWKRYPDDHNSKAFTQNAWARSKS